MTRVHILYEYGIDHKPHGSAHIRLLLPLQHPSIAGRFEVTTGETVQDADVVIVDRTWKYDVSLHDAEALVREVRKRGAVLLYQIDDNLLDLDLSGTFRKPFTIEQCAVIRFFAREADGLLVSTEPLATRMRRLNPNVFVVPNALDERLFADRSTRPAVGTPLKVGYMGTFTHDDDLYMVLEALRTFAGQIELHLVGGIADPQALAASAPLTVRVVTPTCGHDYPDFARWMAQTLDWDIGIAPLEETPFTRCKSDIKFLDYSLLGLPGVFSNVPAYQHTVQHDVTGLLADNTPASWREQLGRLINDADLRERLGRNADAWTRSHRTLAVCAKNWADVIERTVTRKRQSATDTGS